MTANSGLLASLPIPESMVGDGVTCPACGVPFYTTRNPQLPADRAVSTGISIEFEGLLVLCETCVKYLASHVDMIDAVRGKVRASDVRRSERRTAKVREAAETVAAAREALAGADERLEDLQLELGITA